MAAEINKSVNLDLLSLDGNAFALIGAFIRQAKREGWTKDEIDAVTEEAKSGDYWHLVGTLDGYCQPVDDDDDEDDY